MSPVFSLYVGSTQHDHSCISAKLMWINESIEYSVLFRSHWDTHPRLNEQFSVLPRDTSTHDYGTYWWNQSRNSHWRMTALTPLPQLPKKLKCCGDFDVFLQRIKNKAFWWLHWFKNVCARMKVQIYLNARSLLQQILYI